MVRSQPGQIVCETLPQKNPSQKKGAGEVAQGVHPEFKPQKYKKSTIRINKHVQQRHKIQNQHTKIRSIAIWQ
jgi:glutamine amidotransferase-like uncharacterized protein